MDLKEVSNNVIKKLIIDSNSCIGCGACIAVTQDYGIFDFDDNGKSIIIKQPQTEKEIEATNEAIDACCVACISWDNN